MSSNPNQSNAKNTPMADVQSSQDTRNIAIDKVGIKNIRHPVRIATRNGEDQHTVATFNMYVELPHHFKGTHMSRFVHILNNHEHEISPTSFQIMLSEMSELLEADTGYIEMNFPFFINKTAPASGVKSLMDYDVTLIGQIKDGKICTQTSVVVAATSLCPCSKKISDYGAHNQRSHITITAKANDESNDTLWIEDLIDVAEAEASSELYSLLKRTDEKVITERAYDNPKFVEDLVRDVAAHLTSMEKVQAYTVEAENFESIHNHSAYALVSHDKSQ